MKTQIQMITLAVSALVLFLTSSANAGIILTDGAVPTLIGVSGTELDPSIYIIGATGAYTRDFGSDPLVVGWQGTTGGSYGSDGRSHVHLHIQNGSTCISGDESKIGYMFNHTDRLVRLTDASTWTVNGKLIVGGGGYNNRLEVLGGSLVTCTNVSIGDGSYSYGDVTVSNANSKLIVTGDLVHPTANYTWSHLYLEDHALVRVDGTNATVNDMLFGGGYFAWAGDHTSDSSNPYDTKYLWNGTDWQEFADHNVRFTKTYYATDAEAKAATADPDTGFEGYDDLGGYTIWHSYLYAETPSESLLLNPGFADGLTSWTTDEGNPYVSTETIALHDGNYVYFRNCATGQIHQDVDLLSKGYLTADINAGLFAVVFGGWQTSYAGDDFGQIHVAFLDASQQVLETVSLPSIAPDAWIEMMMTNAIPPQTTTLRYIFSGIRGDGSYLNAYLDDAYLNVIDLPPPNVTLTVQSLYGSPEPPVGPNEMPYGTTGTCTVEHVTFSDTQYECIGWMMTDHEPAIGDTNWFIGTLTNNAVLTWNWKTNYWLEIGFDGNGSVDLDPGFQAKGSDHVLTATPDEGWFFMGWDGNISETNGAFITMDGPQAITAVFSIDADNDGLTNTEEASFGSNPWKADTDDDGFDDAFEVAQGMSPTNDNSAITDYIANHGSTFDLYPSNAVLDVAVGQMVIETAGGTATLSLQLEESGDLINWTNAGPAEVWSWPVDGEKKFFRVRSAQ